MKRVVADFLYHLIFPKDRVWRWSYPVWDRLPSAVADFLLGIAA